MQNAFYAAVSYDVDLPGNKYDISEGSKGHISVFWLADFNPFCLILLLSV